MSGKMLALIGGVLIAALAAAAFAQPAGPRGVARLPLGPAWAAGDRCLPFREAAVAARDAVESGRDPRVARSAEGSLRYVPAGRRDVVELCPWQGGWFVAPNGWHEQRAAIGADGSSGWTFVAPGGEAHGWLTIHVDPACASCMLGGAEGYFPDARRLMAALYPDLPAEALSPTPGTLTHPNRCTAVVTYRAGGLRVEGQLYFDPPVQGSVRDPYGDAGLTRVFAALPANEARVRKLMLESFWGGRPPATRPCPTGRWIAE